MTVRIRAFLASHALALQAQFREPADHIAVPLAYMAYVAEKQAAGRDIPALARRQGQLLRATWGLLAPGGTLLYTSCSVLRAENEAVVGAFLAASNGADGLNQV